MPKHMEGIASKGMGKVKAAKARIKGLKGVFQHLADEHGQVTALLQRVAMTDDPKVRKRLFPEIRKELLSHERAEVDVVFPELEEHDETRQYVVEHDRDAAQLESLLDELNTQSFEGEQWGNKFERLVELVKNHTDEEENKYFPAAQKVLGDKRTDELKKQFEKSKQQFMKQIEP